LATANIAAAAVYNPPKVIEDTISIEVSYTTIESGKNLDINVYDPILNRLVPLKKFKYPLEYIKSGKRGILIADLPKEKYLNAIDPSGPGRTGPVGSGFLGDQETNR